ncbi:MAG: pilus assembly protein PilM [Patulibacter sp.]
MKNANTPPEAGSEQAPSKPSLRETLEGGLRRAPRAKKAPTYVGVEIEPGRVTVAEVARGGLAQVKRATCVALDPSVVRDGEVADPQALADALTELWDGQSGLSRKVRIGLANQRVVVRVMDLPPVSDSDLPLVVQQKAAQDLPMPVESAVIDYVSVGEINTPDGLRRRVVLVAARRDMIAPLLEACSAANLRVEGLDLAAFGMSRALQLPTDPDQLLLSVGGLSNLAVMRTGICTFTRVVGGGLEHTAQALSERMSLTIEHARAWLLHVGVATPVAEVEGDAEIVAAARYYLVEGVRRLAGDVRQSMDFERSVAQDALPIEQVVLTGPALQIAGFAEALQQELGLTVVPRTVPLCDGVEDVEPGQVAVAAGLAMGEDPA